MGSRFKRLVAGTLAIALAAISVSSYASWVRNRDELVGLLDELGTAAREPGVVADVLREPDPVRAKLLVGRALLADELDRRWLADLPASAREAAEHQSMKKLETAASLAREALEAQPASWQGRMILAGSTYLGMSRRGDPLRWRDRARWERPLRDAMAMATSQVEPRRILAAAYLNDWSLMTEDEREKARDVLRVAFRDRTTLGQLLPAWLRRADNLEQAFALVPAEPSSWIQVENHFRTQSDWERVCAARERSLEIVPEYTEALLTEARSRLAGGDVKGARALALLALESTPVGPVHREILDHVLEVLPPGPIPPLYQRRAHEWLSWAARECLLRRCPLERSSLQRLRTLAQSETSADRAWAAELVRDLYTSDSYERGELIPGVAEWTSFLLLRANRLTASGEPETAAALLTMIHPDWTDRAVTRSVQARVRAGLGDSRHGEVGWQSPTTLTRGAISFREYSWSQPPEKIRLRFDTIAPAGAAVEIFWSDRWVGCERVDSGATVTVAVPGTPGFHTLEVRPVPGTQAGPESIEVIR